MATKLHPRAKLHIPVKASDKAADAVVGGMGSWRFILIQTCIVALWIAANSLGWFFHWDVYPFILLNLLFSTQAAYASPLILMSQNQQAKKDRGRDDLEAQEVDLLTAMNKEQLEILREVKNGAISPALAKRIDETVAKQIAASLKANGTTKTTKAKDIS